MDMAVLKNTSITERVKLQFRLETYNLFNHPQFGQSRQFSFGQHLWAIAFDNYPARRDDERASIAVRFEAAFLTGREW